MEAGETSSDLHVDTIILVGTYTHARMGKHIRSKLNKKYGEKANANDVVSITQCTLSGLSSNLVRFLLVIIIFFFKIGQAGLKLTKICLGLPSAGIKCVCHHTW